MIPVVLAVPNKHTLKISGDLVVNMFFHKFNKRYKKLSSFVYK